MSVGIKKLTQPRYIALAVAAAALSPGIAAAQQGGDTLPPVDVIQQQPQAQRSTSTRRQAVSPPPRRVAPAPAPTATIDFSDPPEAAQRRDSDGRVIENQTSISPVNPTTTLPADLQGYAGAGSRVTKEDLDEQRPSTNHEALQRVPGIVTITDDGYARHSGIGVRGSPVRRSRKVTIMEDGDTINFSSYIDPSTHYTPPADRVEGIEVIRGSAISHGPLTNHGIVNFFNLHPFGAPETVLTGTIGHTEGNRKDELNYSSHVHHRNQFDNVGIVVSYSQLDASGAWDNERLRYDDFYGAIGWKGREHDLVLSGVYHQQRDRYDEANFERDDFEQFGRCKTCVDPNSNFNNYNSDITRLQAVHNYYIDSETTLTNRIYHFYNDRPRFEADDADPADFPGAVPGDFVMEGRDRQYEHTGAESRIEFANRPFFAGLTQDIQAGVKYEYHEFRNRNRIGELNEKLDVDNRGTLNELDQDYDSNAFSGFIQSALHLRPDVTVTPGVRFEYYDVSRTTFLGEPVEDGDEVLPGDPPLREKTEFENVLPGINFAWKTSPKTTIYGGVARGQTPHVARGEAFPLKNEIGVNSQLGVRSTAILGLTLDAAVFNSQIENYQIREAFTNLAGQNVFGVVDEVEINGVEVYARLDSKPFTGGPLNIFGEAIYTFADSVIEEGVNDDGDSVAGNLLPEVPRQFANLTLGIEHVAGWNASVTYAYRGSFFTDIDNTGSISDEGEEGKVDGQWLLSARANYKIPDTNTTLFVAGQNLEDKLYITDLSDGIKPGQGRTVLGGVTVKFDHSRPLESAK